MRDPNKPNFLSNNNVTSINEGNSTVESSSNNGFRSEIGAIWNRQSKKTDLNYMTIKLELSKDKLKQLLQSEDSQVVFNLIAFPNKTQNGNDNRPSFRVYEDVKR